METLKYYGQNSLKQYFFGSFWAKKGIEIKLMFFFFQKPFLWIYDGLVDIVFADFLESLSSFSAALHTVNNFAKKKHTIFEHRKPQNPYSWIYNDVVNIVFANLVKGDQVVFSSAITSVWYFVKKTQFWAQKTLKDSNFKIYF